MRISDWSSDVCSSDLEETHALFKRFVAEYRPQLDIDRVATGEHWFGSQALELKLVDQLQTSDDYLLARTHDAELFSLRFRRRQALAQRLSEGLVKLGLGLRRSVAETTLPRSPGSRAPCCKELTDNYPVATCNRAALSDRKS